MKSTVGLSLVFAVAAALLLPSTALAGGDDDALSLVRTWSDVRVPCPFQRILDDAINKELDGDSAPPPEPENPTGSGGLEGRSTTTVPMTRVTTTANFRMNLLMSGEAINDEEFRGAVEYGDFWDTVIGGDANLNINIIPFASIYVMVGFQYALSSGPQPYGEVGTGSEGEYEFSNTFFAPVHVGIKLSFPFLAPPSTWFNPRKSIDQGPLIRLRVAGGINLVGGGDITVLSGSKQSATPYTLWEEWAWGGSGYGGIGFEYKVQEAFTFFVEIGAHVVLAPDTSSDMTSILKKPGDLEPAAVVSFPFLIGVTFNW